MKHHTYPTPTTLVTVWFVLMLATIATMIAGKVTEISSIGTLWMGVLMVVTWLKATLILRYFLDLKSATSGWSTGFGALIIFILIALFGLYVLGSGI